jgi:hypothetical protein
MPFILYLRRWSRIEYNKQVKTTCVTRKTQNFKQTRLNKKIECIVIYFYLFIYLYTHKACRNKSNDQKANTYIKMSSWPVAQI